MRNFSSHFRRLLKPLALATVIAVSAVSVTYGQNAPADSSATATPASTLAGDAAAGEALFKANCTSCHALNKRVLEQNKLKKSLPKHYPILELLEWTLTMSKEKMNMIN